MTDDEVLSHLRHARNSEKFERLFDTGDINEYPSHSEADAGLLAILAFWTQDKEQLDRLFRLSALYRETKWEQEGYRDLTMNFVLNRLTETWQATEPESVEYYTDVWNMDRLVRAHGDSLRYCGAVGWLGWTGTHWRTDADSMPLRLAIETVRQYYQEANSLDEPDAVEELIKHARASESSGKLNAMVRLAKMHETIEVHRNDFDRVFDRDPHILAVRNGVLDLQTGELREHRREDYLTKLAPVDYDPAADCPLWLGFLDQIMSGDAELIAFIQRAFGYCLSGDVSERAFFICHGEGRNGKSTLLEVFGEVLGPDYATPSRSEILMSQGTGGGGGANNEVARLIGYRYTWCIETRARERMNEGMVKKLSGNDMITARLLYREPIVFRPQFKIFLATNNEPLITETIAAIWDRVKLIPFKRRFTADEQDLLLKDKLLTEATGILNWALVGYRDWRAHGLGSAAVVEAATADYRSRMDPIGRFLAACVVADPDRSIGSSELYAAFKHWCQQNGDPIQSHTLFSPRVEAAGFPKRPEQRTGRMVFHGCRLVTVVRFGSRGV